ncbi:MAG: hypothetical protein ABEJ40_03550 [Haloarculaceae archaeon]
MDRRYVIGVAESTRALVGLVYLGGAAVHLLLWATNRGVYDELTEYVLSGWYRDLWTELVLPNLAVLLPLLAAFEVLVAVAVLSKGRAVRLGLAAGAGFNLAVAPLGFWWPSNVALAAVHAALLRVSYPSGTLDLVRHRFAPDAEDGPPPDARA